MWFFATEVLLGTPYGEVLFRLIHGAEMAQARDATSASLLGFFRHDALTYSVAMTLFTRPFRQTMMARGSPTNTASAMRP